MDFCVHCGTLLEYLPTKVICKKCSWECPYNCMKNSPFLLTFSSIFCAMSQHIMDKKAKRHFLSQKKLSKKKKNQKQKLWFVSLQTIILQYSLQINETCPRCGHNQLYYSTMQLRSADEGQTVFYECPKCHYIYSENN